MGPITADAHNRVNPQNYSYDASGNLTFDGADYLTFDAENRVNPVSGLHYYYDGDGHRVAKSDGSRYWYDDAFNVISMADGSNTLKRDFVYFNGHRLGWVSVSSGDPHYNVSDHLGSPHVVANGDGSVVSWEEDYFPFGGVQPISNADGLTVNYQFTGYEYDFELHDNYADFREQSPVLGRFFSPDRLGGDLANPQSLNRYAYVMNNPVNLVDPLGLCGEPDDVITGPDGSITVVGHPECADPGYPIAVGFNPGTYCIIYGCGGYGVNGSVTNFPMLSPATSPSPKSNGCSDHAGIGKRVASGIQGTLNLAIASSKLLASAGLATASVAGAPETAGLSLSGLAVAAYGAISATGQATTGIGQIYSAFGGNSQASNGIQQAGDIVGGPVSGVPVLIGTQNPETAQRFANRESLLTAGAGAVNSRGLAEAVQGSVDFALNLANVSGAGCN